VCVCVCVCARVCVCVRVCVRVRVRVRARLCSRAPDDACLQPNLFTHALGGILVAAVDASSGAAAAGLAAGDVVTGVSGSDISLMTHADALRVLQSAVASARAQAAQPCVLLEIVKPYAPPPIHLFALASAALSPVKGGGGGGGSSSSSSSSAAKRSAVDPQLQWLDSKSRGSMRDITITKPAHSEWGFSLAKQIVTADMDVSSFSAATYGAVIQTVVADSPAAACGIVPGTIICKVNGSMLPCTRGTAAVFDAIRRGLEQGAAAAAGVTLTVILPHTPPPFARASDGSRRGGGVGGSVKSSRSKHREGGGGLGSSTSGGAAAAAAAAAADSDGDAATEDVEMDQMGGGASASISKGRALPSGASELLVKVTPMGLGFVPSKILVSSDFDCRCGRVSVLCARALTGVDCRSFTRARFGLLAQSIQSGGASEQAGMWHVTYDF